MTPRVAPDVFTLLDDGLAYMREGDTIYATAKGNAQGDYEATDTTTFENTPSASCSHVIDPLTADSDVVAAPGQ